MSVTSSAATQQKFTNVRKRLDQLGYRQPLGIESLPLVERLFADLVHTTESLKKAKLSQSKDEKEKGSFDAKVEPYKSDNAKLIKENNELHRQLIMHTEDSEAKIKDLKAGLRKLEHENADLLFLNNQYIHKVRALEKESKSKSERILQLQEKNFHAVVQTPGGRKKNIPFRRQRMEIDSQVPPSESSSIPTTPPSDPYIADLLQVADDRIAALTEESELLKEEKEAAEGKIKTLRQKVDTRDAEIDRLTRLLAGGRPHDVVALETRNRSNERLISHLNIQIDYLQQRNQDLQKQVDELITSQRAVTDKTIDLDAKNFELEQELHDVDRIARRLQVDKDEVIRVADQEILDAKGELEKSREEMDGLDMQVKHLREERTRLVTEREDLKAELVSEKANHQRIESLVDKIQEDKKRLSQRVDKLLTNEKVLVMELNRVKHSKNGVVKKGTKAAQQTEQLIKALEEEKEYWKGEVDTLQKLRQTRSHSPGHTSRSSSPGRASRSLTSTPSKPKSRTTSPSSTPSKSDKKSSSHYEAIVRVLEDERDHYKRECDLLKALRTRPASPTRTSPSKAGPEESELAQVIQQRDELQNLLDKFERHMAEIQANVKVLTGERDNLNDMYEQTKEELQRLRREVVRSPKSPKTSLAAQAVLRRVENERDEAVSDLRRMTTERDSLRERLKIATETQLADRARLEQRIEDLEAEFNTVEMERNDVSGRLQSVQRMISSLEEQVQGQTVQLTGAQDQASQHKATATQMRLLAEQAERSLEDHQARLAKKEADLHAAEQRILQLEERIIDLTHSNQKDRDDIIQLRSTIGALDREKDTLQVTVDNKTEKVVRYEDELTAKDKSITELRANMRELEVTIDHYKEEVASKDHEVRSLRRQLDGTSEELTETGRAREVALRENRRIQDDLANMTRENQQLNQDLQDAVEERETLKTQVQDYIMEVKRTEEILAAKEQERSDLLEQYRVLSLEAERYETQTHQLESEGSNLRLEIMTKDSENRRLHEKVDMLEREIQEHLRAQQAYEVQVSLLTKSVANLEEALRQMESERHTTMDDMTAVRDLCAKLEATRDSLQRQLTSKSLDHEKLASDLQQMKQETEILRSQVSGERQNLRGLEEILQSNREKEFHSQLVAQEKTAEIQLLKDRLSLNDSKMESQSRELTTLRARTIELEAEVDRLRRTLTNTRFERERAVQELRRHGFAPPGEGHVGHSSGANAAFSPNRSRSRSPTSRAFYSRSFIEDDPLTSMHTV